MMCLLLDGDETGKSRNSHPYDINMSSINK